MPNVSPISRHEPPLDRTTINVDEWYLPTGYCAPKDNFPRLRILEDFEEEIVVFLNRRSIAQEGRSTLDQEDFQNITRSMLGYLQFVWAMEGKGISIENLENKSFANFRQTVEIFALALDDPKCSPEKAEILKSLGLYILPWLVEKGKIAQDVLVTPPECLNGSHKRKENKTKRKGHGDSKSRNSKSNGDPGREELIQATLMPRSAPVKQVTESVVRASPSKSKKLSPQKPKPRIEKSEVAKPVPEIPIEATPSGDPGLMLHTTTLPPPPVLEIVPPPKHDPLIPLLWRESLKVLDNKPLETKFNELVSEFIKFVEGRFAWRDPNFLELAPSLARNLVEGRLLSFVDYDVKLFMGYNELLEKKSYTEAEYILITQTFPSWIRSNFRIGKDGLYRSSEHYEEPKFSDSITGRKQKRIPTLSTDLIPLYLTSEHAFNRKYYSEGPFVAQEITDRVKELRDRVVTTLLLLAISPSPEQIVAIRNKHVYTFSDGSIILNFPTITGKSLSITLEGIPATILNDYIKFKDRLVKQGGFQKLSDPEAPLFIGDYGGPLIDDRVSMENSPNSIWTLYWLCKRNQYLGLYLDNQPQYVRANFEGIRVQRGELRDIEPIFRSGTVESAIEQEYLNLIPPFQRRYSEILKSRRPINLPKPYVFLSAHGLGLTGSL